MLKGMATLVHLGGLKGRNGPIVAQCLRLMSSVTSSLISDIRQQLTQYKGGSVDLEKDDSTGIAVITINNPEVKNAMTGQMIVDLADCVTELESWKLGKGVILTGANNTFCSGGDLNFVRQICQSENGYRMSVFMNDSLIRFCSLPLVSVALIQGLALGGGAELPLACDLRVMTESSRLGFIQIKLGLSSGWGGGTRLTNLLGKAKALDILCSGQILNAKTWKELGLADKLFSEKGDVLQETKNWMLTNSCHGEKLLIQSVKSVVTTAEEDISERSFQREREIFRTVWGGPFQIEALNKNIKHK